MCCPSWTGRLCEAKISHRPHQTSSASTFGVELVLLGMTLCLLAFPGTPVKAGDRLLGKLPLYDLHLSPGLPMDALGQEHSPI